MIEPWTFIEQSDEPTIEVKKSAWTNGHEKNCNFLQYLIYSNASDQIEHHTNAKKSMEYFESIFKPGCACFLNNALRKLNNLTLYDCQSFADYVTQFCSLINKFRSFCAKFKLDDNFYVYRFQSNLGPDYANYFECYTHDHNPFDGECNIKYTLSLAIQHFKNKIKTSVLRIY